MFLTGNFTEGKKLKTTERQQENTASETTSPTSDTTPFKM